MRAMRELVYFGDGPDERTAEQARVCRETETEDRVALMADGHKGYAVPIGGVVAYRDASVPPASDSISPAETRQS